MGNTQIPPVRLWSFAGNHFVLVNSIAFHGDKCELCQLAEYNLNKVSKFLHCLKLAFPFKNATCYFNELKSSLTASNLYIDNSGDGNFVSRFKLLNLINIF